MWISNSALDLFKVSQETVNQLRQENAVLKAENSLLQHELTSAKVHLDWLRVQFNQLQLERAELMDKVNGIRVPVPELAPRNKAPKRPTLEEFNFEDIGDEVAAKLGLPRYDLPPGN